MSLNAIAKLLIFFGSIILLKALTMDTTVGSVWGRGVYNVGLLHEKDNFITLGSVFFLAGIILIATSKTNEPERIEHKKPINPFIKIAEIEDAVIEFFNSIPKFVPSIFNNPNTNTYFAGQVALLIVVLILLIYVLLS